MWILDCDGDALQRKRVWLKPGKQYLFGRTSTHQKKERNEFGIDHSKVSRKQMTLAVSGVKAGDGSLVETRSELTIEDSNSKYGTEIDGENIIGAKRTLTGDHHAFRLGRSEQIFQWKPVILSFTFPSKDTKNGKDPLIPTRSKLEDLDIKTILHYIVDQTTHVVSSKRNTAKCLQALINGRHVVDYSFIDALVYATTPENLDEPESLSPLEEDFDASWPKEKDHLPQPSKEPNQRPAELFAPDATRREIFDGYTFIFCDQRQFENLQAPIFNGGGEALYFQIKPGVTTTGEIVRYVKDTAGEKDSEELRNSGEGRGVALVRASGEKGYEDWAASVFRQVSLDLGQRLVEQNEFLDAILMNDPTPLRRALPTGEMDVSQSSSHAPSADSQGPQPPTPSRPLESRPARGRPRGKIVSTFRGFDDGFEPTQVKPGGKLDIGTNETPQNDSIVVESDEDEVIPATRKSRKRTHETDEEDEDILDENLLPAAAAMKKLRIDRNRDSKQREVSGEVSEGTRSKQNGAEAKKKKKQKEIDIQEVVKERRKAQDEAARRDEENLKEALDSMTAEEMKNLAVTEEMEVKPRTDRPQHANGENPRWDDKWNGRKNFKKFRRRGDGPIPRRGQTVMVPLEEVKKKGFGIENDYYLESDRAKKKRREREPSVQSQSQTFTSAHSHQEAVPSELASGEGRPEVIGVNAPRTTRLYDKSAQSQQSTSRSQDAVTTGSKRSAPAAGKTAAAKKQKLLSVREDSDSEDEMKFRLRKRR